MRSVSGWVGWQGRRGKLVEDDTTKKYLPYKMCLLKLGGAGPVKNRGHRSLLCWVVEPEIDVIEEKSQWCLFVMPTLTARCEARTFRAILT